MDKFDKFINYLLEIKNYIKKKLFNVISDMNYSNMNYPYHFSNYTIPESHDKLSEEYTYSDDDCLYTIDNPEKEYEAYCISDNESVNESDVLVIKNDSSENSSEDSTTYIYTEKDLKTDNQLNNPFEIKSL